MISERQLADLGFSPKEAKVYLALLELGPSTATTIALKADINRTSAYDILESLANEGLISPVGEEKVQKFIAKNPQQVITYLERKITENQQKLAQAKTLLPELLSIFSLEEKPKVKFYEGIDGLKESLNDTLTARGEITAYATGADIMKTLNQRYIHNYLQQREARNIHVRLITSNDQASRSVPFNHRQKLCTPVFIPQDKLFFSVETIIYDNKILMISWLEKFSIIIESAKIAQSQKKIFELAWLGAQQLAE